ncbi:MAG: hypothetical protein ABIL37_03425 [candidate division WOR-3 bacterium]
MKLEELETEEKEKIIKLLEEFRTSNEPRVELSYKDKIFTIYVIAKDWAGIMDAVLGIFHDEGFNIHFAYAMATENDEAIIVLKIKNLNESEIIRLEENKNKFLNLLKTAVKGGISLTRLLNIGTKKVKIYNQVMDKLKEICTDRDYVNIASENGELIKFILSRSEQYLSERKVEDLAYIVCKSYELQKAYLESKKIQVDIHNFITTKEKLTGITIVGNYENVSLDEVLEALKEVVSNFQRKFDKEFITDHGFVVIRLEISDENGSFISEEKHPIIVSYLKEEFSKPKEKRSKFFKIRTGMELYGRILIPYLISETERTSIPQLLILPEDIDTNRIDLRLFIILPEGQICQENILIEILRNRGFLVLSIESKNRGNLKVIHIKLSAPLENFENEIDVYNSLKNSIMKIVPKIRDFDEGMRNLNVQKLYEVMDIIGNKVSERIVKRLFYQYDDILRLNLSAKDIADEINLIYNLLTRFLSIEKPIYDHIELDKFYILGFSTKRDNIDIEKMISIYEEKMHSFSVFEIYNVGVVILRFPKSTKIPEILGLTGETILVN